ncbi:MAG: penicillin-binding protein 1C [Rubrivivax sp.]
MGAFGGIAAAHAASATVPTFEAVRAAHQPSDLPLLDRQGAVLQLVRVDNRVRRGPWLSIEQMSPALLTAMVLGEDRRFWDHGGVDWRALAASAWAQALNRGTRGASTLTMQLAGLLDNDLARPAGGRSVWQKLSQMQRAQHIEAAWSKSQIFEAWLNRVPLRGELVGVAAASLQLFGKHASGLDHTEAALLAAMVRGPNASAATVQRRACEGLQLQQMGCDGVAITLAQALARKPHALASGTGEVLAPHVAAIAAAASVGAFRTEIQRTALRTTLDARLQRIASATLRRQLAELRGREVDDGAVLVLDNRSGEVLAWVGSSGSGLSQAASVDAVLARRQPGSTLKPLVYASALQQRLITAASVLDDTPLQMGSGIGAGVYQPQNHDHGFSGAVSVRTALASSLNVPAVRVGAMVGPDALWARLNDAGLRVSESGGYHGHALALGSAEVSLLDLANAYRMLANGGWWSPLQGVPGAAMAASSSPSSTPAAHRVFEPAVAFIVGDILSDSAARSLTFGLDSPLPTRRWSAVKTGTSKDLRDGWCVGYTRRHTVAVWVGNAAGAPMHGVTGVGGAAPVWREVVAAIDSLGLGATNGQPTATSAPQPPPGLVRQRGEWFLAGTEPAALLAGAARRFGITSPSDGSIYALDPDIPMATQRIVFEGLAGVWRVDGEAVGQGARVSWLPRPGRHVLDHEALDAAAGTAPQRITFEVRTGPAQTAGVVLKKRSTATSITMPHKL